MRNSFFAFLMCLGVSNLLWGAAAEPINLPLKYKCSTFNSSDIFALVRVYEMPKGVNHPYLVTLELASKTEPDLYSGAVTGVHSKDVMSATAVGDYEISLWNIAEGGWQGHLRKSQHVAGYKRYVSLMLDLHESGGVPKATDIELRCDTKASP